MRDLRWKENTMHRLFFPMLAAAVLPLLTGCGVTTTTAIAPITTSPAATVTYTGRVMGGQQPVSGASVYLVAAAAYGSYGGPSNPASYASASTDSSGHFSLTSSLNCQANLPMYILVLSGDAGGGTNGSLAEMAALGLCDSLTSNTNIQINELTTVASVYALAQFFNGSPYISTTENNSPGLMQAFADVTQLTDTTAGTIPGPALPAGATFPTTKLNTLANIIAACVNSAGGTAGDHSICGNLFAAATPLGGRAPTDTVTALANIAQNPAANVPALFSVATAQPFYQPSLTQAPSDWLLAVKYKPSGMSAPSAVATDGSGNVWVTNKGGNNIVELSHAGVLETTVSSGFSAPSALALDLSGNVWVAQSGTNSMTHVLANGSSGTTVPSATGGLSLPSGIAIDPAGNLWIADAGANTVTELNSSGAPVSANGYSGTGILKPLGITISPH
jgi:hypothetical protein